MASRAPIAVALDAPDLNTAAYWADLVTPHVSTLKIGLELYLRFGPEAVASVRGVWDSFFVGGTLWPEPFGSRFFVELNDICRDGAQRAAPLHLSDGFIWLRESNSCCELFLSRCFCRFIS